MATSEFQQRQTQTSNGQGKAQEQGPTSLHGIDPELIREAPRHGFNVGSLRHPEAQKALRHRIAKAKQMEAGKAAASSDAPVHMDPSVEALFHGEQSSDQELGTGDKEVTQQAGDMVTALDRHLVMFQLRAHFAVSVALGHAAGLGKEKIHASKIVSDRLAALTQFAVKVAWDHCGISSDLKALTKLAKEELMGNVAEYADKAYEKTKSQIEKRTKEISLDEITLELAATVTENTDLFVSRARAGFIGADKNALSGAYRLMRGTADNATTASGEKLNREQKLTITTMFLEQLTGIPASGQFATQLSNTIRQRALVDFAMVQSNAGDRNNVMQDVLSGKVMGETERIVDDMHARSDLDNDAAARKSVTQ